MSEKRELSCTIELSFINGPFWFELPGNPLKLYFFLWARAVEQRREDLGILSSVYLANKNNLKANKIASYLKLIAECGPSIGQPPLISYVCTGQLPAMFNISVLYVADKHPKLKNIRRTKKSISLNQTKEETKKETKEIKISLKNKFVEFKKTYPKAPPGRTSWTDAEKKFKQLVEHGVDPDDLIKAAKNYSSTTRTNSNGDDFTRGAQGFLGPRVWWREYLEPPDDPDEPRIPTTAEIDRALSRGMDEDDTP